MKTPCQYIQHLVDTLTKRSLQEFFEYIHKTFYPNQDISFMEYFLELTEHDGEFYVPHQKLVEYGVMTSTNSAKVNEKLHNLRLDESVDYLLADVRQQHKSGIKHAKQYLLTPQAFKKCLMRAQRRPNQPIDPVIYADYYLLLEKIFKYYTDYEKMYKDKVLSMKDDKIDNLTKQTQNLQKTVEEQTNLMKDSKRETEELKQMLRAQGVKLDEVNVKLDESKVENIKLIDLITELNHKIDLLRQDIRGLVQIIAKVCATPAVVSDLIELYSNGPIQFDTRAPYNGIQACKIMFMSVLLDKNNNQLTFWLACRNFSQTPKRLAEQFANAKRRDLIFHNAVVVGMCDKDVNEELSLFDKAFKKFSLKTDKHGEIDYNQKTFTIDLDDNDKVDDLTHKLFIEMRNQFLMRHQRGVLKTLKNNKASDQARIQASEAFKYAIHFNNAIIGYSQGYIDSFLDKNNQNHVNRILTGSQITEKLKIDLMNSRNKELSLKQHFYYMYLIKKEASMYQEESYVERFTQIQNEKDRNGENDLEEYDIDNYSCESDESNSDDSDEDGSVES